MLLDGCSRPSRPPELCTAYQSYRGCNGEVLAPVDQYMRQQPMAIRRPRQSVVALPHVASTAQTGPAQGQELADGRRSLRPKQRATIADMQAGKCSQPVAALNRHLAPGPTQT